uniref:PD-(D/E)XK nuclease family transposase n=1 Tax=Streptococcus sp. 1453 TaxID=2582661 RepID=UPI001590CF1B
FSNPEITCQFIRDMLDLPAKNVTILEGSNIHVLPSLPYSAQDFYTSIDVLAELDNGTQVIIEIQVHHQNFFINRLWAYLCSQVNQNLEKIRQREGDTHQSYKHIAPVYAIAIVDSNYFSDDQAFHSFSMREDTTGEVLTITNNGQEHHLVKMAFLELRKYRETSKDSIRKPWLEFFGNKPFTQEPERAISQADQLLDYKSWSEEDRKMFSQLRMREEQALLAQDYALEQAEEKGLERGRAEGIEQGLERGLERGRAEGIEQGIEKGLAQGLERGRAEGIEQGLKVGLVNLVRQGILTPEVASRQLGMTVAEFEELLKDNHK